MVTLAEEEPFAAVVDEQRLSTVCSSCFEMTVHDTMKADRLSRCAKCRVVSYCSKECQIKDWVNHKNECSVMVRCFPAIPASTVRLVCRIIFKLGRSDAQAAAFNGRVFNDLMDHRKEVEMDPRLKNVAPAVYRALEECVDKQFVPTRDVLMSIIGKVYTNSFNITLECNSIGTGLYIGISAHDHSCVPDAHIHFDGAKAVLRSPDVKKKYSKELTLPYVGLISSNKKRKEELSVYYFTCTCSVCSDPTRDFLCNSAVSTCCPDSYCLLDPSASHLSCFKCGAPSEITVVEAIAANYEANAVCELEDSDIIACCGAYDNISMVLSPLNVNLLRIAERIFYASFGKNDALCLKYGPYILPAVKHYLSVGNPNLTYRLVYVAQAMAKGPKPTRKVMQAFNEALAASIVSHGQENMLTLIVQDKMLTFKNRLRNSE